LNGLKPPETAASFFAHSLSLPSGAVRENADRVSDLSLVDNGPLTSMTVFRAAHG
jgi:hypothetical protein